MAEDDAPGGGGPGTVKVPGIGKVKGEQLAVGLAVVGGIVAYAWWRARAGDGGGAALDPNDVVPAATHQPEPTGDATVDVDVGGGHPRTNAAWGQSALELLSNAGWEPLGVTVAVGKFLSRQALTDKEVQIVQAAVGLLGPPPEGGPWPITRGGAGTPPGSPPTAAKTTITLSKRPPSTVRIGSPMTFSGTVRIVPKPTGAIRKTVVMEYRNGNVGPWIKMRERGTYSTGTWSFTIRAWRKSRSYRFTVKGTDASTQTGIIRVSQSRRK